MAETVGSVVVQEAVGQILSGLVQRYAESNASRNLERLEMAQIRLEAALETSEKWQITDTSLLRWRRKLKRAAQECDDTLRECKRRIREEEETEQEVRNSAFPKRIAHAAKSFVLSSFRRDGNELSRSAVQRFEWFADGASEFVRFVRFGGTPQQRMAFNSLIKHLLAGKKLQHKVARGHGVGGSLFLLCLAPVTTTEHGVEGRLLFLHKDSNAPEDDFVLIVMLQLSESTDIVGIIIKCLQLFTPNFKSVVETIETELTQLPTQDLSWVPCIDSWQIKHWNNLHRFSSLWFRPNPLCCKQDDQHKLCRSSKLYTSGSLDVCLEPVIDVFLQGQVSLSGYNKHWTSLSESGCTSLKNNSTYLKVGIAFTPHSSLQDTLPADSSSAIAAVEGEEQHFLHRNITLEELEEIMLPKAAGYFRQNAKATVYQMLWKSAHGAAYIQVEKASIRTLRTSARAFQRARKGKMVQEHDRGIGRQTDVVFRFLNLWVAHAPVQLRGSIVEWIQKEKEGLLAAP